MQDRLKINEEIKSISKSKGKVSAVAYCKQALDMGLAEAKDYVENLLESLPVFSIDNASGLDEQIRQLLSENKELEAIKLYKVTTNSDLKTAADYVRSMMKPLHEKESANTKNLDEKIKQLIAENRKLEAIKLHKETTHCDLAVSLDYVNRIIDPNYSENSKTQKQSTLTGSISKSFFSFVLSEWINPVFRFFSGDKA
jgi:ribosomal protein L7/L12